MRDLRVEMHLQTAHYLLLVAVVLVEQVFLLWTFLLLAVMAALVFHLRLQAHLLLEQAAVVVLHLAQLLAVLVSLVVALVTLKALQLVRL
jgi:hypothetical protein